MLSTGFSYTEIESLIIHLKDQVLISSVLSLFDNGRCRMSEIILFLEIR